MLATSSRHASSVLVVSRPVPHLAPRPVSACLPCMPFVSHRLIGSPSVRLIRSPTGSAACFIRLFFSSAHRLAPCLVSPGSPYHRQAGRGGDAILIGVVAAADGVERRRVLLACLGAMGGAARSSLFPISSAHPIDYGSRVLPSSYHPIDGEGAFFSFPPDSLPSALLGLLAVACSPVPGRGMWGLRHGLRQRACGLLDCVLIPPFRSLAPARSLAAICPPCRLRRCAYLGRCWAFDVLFWPLTCRRWHISIYALKWHPVASHGHFRRCCPLPFLASPRRLVLAPLPCCLFLLGCGVMTVGAGVFLR